VGSEPGSSRFHLFSHFSPLYRWATAAPQVSCYFGIGEKVFASTSTNTCQRQKVLFHFICTTCFNPQLGPLKLLLYIIILFWKKKCQFKLILFAKPLNANWTAFDLKIVSSSNLCQKLYIHKRKTGHGSCSASHHPNHSWLAWKPFKAIWDMKTML
jgi:hypothetical protein